ncbi:MAG: hypothetical protein LKE29_07355 [Acidaminococcaceae bacterium]|nr:hypothetical protein [Acidaminococcaceae bacterium]
MKKKMKDGSAPVLNDRQKHILEYIREFISTKGFPPTVREIGKAVGLSSSASVHANLHKLADMGILSRDQDKPRAISVTEMLPGVRRLLFLYHWLALYMPVSRF